jgi:DNA-binding CsgD family transcriptional regulator
MRQRLRALQASLITESPEAEAILRPDGRAEHATGLAKERGSLEQLRSGVAAIEHARRLAADDPHEALAIWEALVEGRWSLLDCFERDGRRYWVAHRNEPEVPEVRALTGREQQVAAYAALGQSNKLISYELGLSRSSVAAHLRSARAKLGATTRVALVQALSAERDRRVE